MSESTTRELLRPKRAPTRTWQLSGHGASIAGSKGRNDDAWRVSDRGCAVADGIGSKPRAADSARFAVSEFERLVDLETDLASIGDRINSSTLERFGRDGGTTLVAAVVRPTGIVIGHCGDSRALIVAGGAVRRLTRDHTVHEFALDLGLDPAGDPELDDEALVSHVGMTGDFRFDVLAVPFSSDDRLVLVTDGVYKSLGENEMCELISDQPLSAAADLLAANAVERGATDDCTAVVVEACEVMK